MSGPSQLLSTGARVLICSQTPETPERRAFGSDRASYVFAISIAQRNPGTRTPRKSIIEIGIGRNLASTLVYLRSPNGNAVQRWRSHPLQRLVMRPAVHLRFVL